MMVTTFLLSLCLLGFQGCQGKGDIPEEFMLLAGPLTHSLVKDLTSNPSASKTFPSDMTETQDVFDCSLSLPSQIKAHFQFLQSRGVTHFKVPLSWSHILPTGEPSQPHQDTVRCYRSLLEQLTASGLQPLVVLHRSAVPERLRATLGDWDSPELPAAFERYAEFVFSQFGDLVKYWITFSHLDELNSDGGKTSFASGLQGALDAHERVYQLYHRMLSTKGGHVAFGVRAHFYQRGSTKTVKSDFVSLVFDYECSPQTSLEEQLRQVYSDVPVIIYQFNTRSCSRKDTYSPISWNALRVLETWRDGRVLGCDLKLFPSQLRDRLTQHKRNNEMLNKNSLSSYMSVWQSFSSQSPSERDDFLIGSFPEGFQWAVSSESFKVEGGWSEHGKGETIWDRFGHQGHAFDKQTADLACDSYNKVDYDVYLLRGLLTDTYQFSISWARIFPTGLKGSLSEKGVLYYDNLINALLQSGIQPVVTLYHWDLPQALQDNGGWTNPTIVEAFKDFADFCFSRFGDRVKTWNTFSSPWVVSHFGYGTGEHAPGVKDPVIGSYQVTHNILKSHAEAWHVYNDNYRKQQNGKVGIALNSDWAEPKNSASPQDVEAAERYLDFMLGWFAHPIFVDGDYPAELKTQIQQKNQQCNPTGEVARLPVFTDAEKQRIKGTADFFGLNHYTTRLITESTGACSPGPHNVGDFQSHVDASWPTTASNSVHVVPWGLRRLLKYISTKYTATMNVPVHITGTGMPTANDVDNLNDTQRIHFLRNYINEALKATNEDKVNLQKFTVQSLMDGFEGPHGYSHRYGLHYVNYKDLNRPRTPKESAYVYADIVKKNGFADVQRKPAGSTSIKYFQTTRMASLPASEVPSKAKIVWQTLSSETKFQRSLYHYGTFPEGFQWGVSSSAYQIEGAWNQDGKGPSVWDTFTQKPGSIPHNDNGNTACDSYNKLEEDLYMLRALQVKSYRFSLSWSRIFPNGEKTNVNQKGVDYYNRLIDGLLANNITPMVTLYHWDLPQALQNSGGWDNAVMIDRFNDFCDFCFSTFGKRVKFWITFNQPYSIAWFGYGLGQYPPNVEDPGNAPYRVAHNLLKAHAKVYHTYDTNFRAAQGGLVSISLNADWAEPKDHTDPKQIAAADRALQFQLGWFAHPIFKNGDYPDAMKWQVGNKSALQDLKISRLPTFTDQEKKDIQGTADVFCINSHTTYIVRHLATVLTPPSYEADQELGKEEEWSSPGTALQGHRAVSWGLRRLLNWIKEEYGDPDIYITDNGMASPRDQITVEDTDRTFFLKTYIDEALKAQNLDGVKVKGYTWYNLMDSFEWRSGYQVGFGLHHIDFRNSLRPRTPKQSAHYYNQIIRDNGFPETLEHKLIYGHFREDFAWSTSTAAYQTEGGWRADGKGLSIWDKFSHLPGKITNDDTGDVACDSYNKFMVDVANLKILKVGHYRLSISWSRVLPDGTINNINEAGFDFYHRLIDALLAANIKPQVTLYHWDLPQALQDKGGWENEESVQWFKDYANIVFERLGDKVKFWITFNEPWIVALIGYGYGTFAPGVSERPGTGPYEVAHNIIKSHAEAWHIYNDNYRATQKGIISITINHDWAFPRNPSKQDDLDMVKRYNQFFIGWFANPIFKGDYGELMKNAVRERSLAAGLPKSRLPEFTPTEIERIKGTHDYFGLNHYTSVMAFRADYGNEQNYDADRGIASIYDWSWMETGSSWLKVTPHAFRQLLNFIKDEYGNPPIYVTENGVSEKGPVDLNDVHRIHYYKNYINQALKAYLIDGVDIRGYTAWSLMDNYEWASGYSERFGLFYVNRSDPSLPRIPKQSAEWYTSIILNNGFTDPSNETVPPEAQTTSPTVKFLGMDVSIPDATVTLNVLFSLTIIGAALAALTAFLYFRAKNKSKSV